MTPQDGGARPGLSRPGTAPSLTCPTDIERVRRRWRLNQQLKHRQHCDALDRHLGVSAVADANRVTPNWDDYALGFEERRARGLALIEQGRAA